MSGAGGAATPYPTAVTTDYGYNALVAPTPPMVPSMFADDALGIDVPLTAATAAIMASRTPSPPEGGPPSTRPFPTAGGSPGGCQPQQPPSTMDVQ